MYTPLSFISYAENRKNREKKAGRPNDGPLVSLKSRVARTGDQILWLDRQVHLSDLTPR